MLIRWQFVAVTAALFVAALVGAYMSGWNARGAHEVAKLAARQEQARKTVEEIRKDVKEVDDNGLADRLSRDR